MHSDGARSGKVKAYWMGSSISGAASCATTLPSINSTAEWTTLWGWTSTVICSGVTSNRRIASMNSSPLFIIVALSTLIFAPMLQLGWATASAGVL